MSRDTAASLWERAQEHDHAGRFGRAREAYGLVAVHLLRHRQPVPSQLLERIARALERLGEYRFAMLFLSAMQKRGIEASDRYSVFHTVVLSAEVALSAGDIASCAKFLEKLEDDTGCLLAHSSQPSATILNRLSLLRFGRTSRIDLEFVANEATLVFARYWGNLGKFQPAINACTSVYRKLSGEDPLLSRNDVGILLTELTIDAGDFPQARGLIAELREACRDPRATQRLQLIDARLAVLEGRLSAARKALAAPNAVSSQFADIQITRILVQSLVLLNRVSEAEAALDALYRRVDHGSETLAILEQIEAVAALVRCRRGRMMEGLDLPFTAKQVMCGPSSELQTEVAPIHSSEASCQPFGNRWATEANNFLSALEAEDISDQALTLARLKALSQNTDSLFFRARTLYYLALGAYYSGDLKNSCKLATQSLTYFNDQCLSLDKWRVQTLLVWTTAAEGDVDGYVRVSADAQTTLTSIMSNLDPEDRVFFALNKWSAQDDYVAARVKGLQIHLASRKKWFPQHLPLRFGWLDGVKETVLTLSLFRAVDRLVGWDLTHRLEGKSVAAPVDVSTLEAVLLEHMKLGSGRRHRKLSYWRLLQTATHRAVVYYYVLADRLIVFLLWRGCARVRVFPCSRLALDQQIRHLLAGIGKRNDVATTAKLLSSLLGLDACLREIPKTVSELFLVPHDVLINVPFAYLPTESGRCLCQRVTLIHLPHLEALTPWGAGRPPRSSSTLLSVGLSVYPGTGLCELPNAELEAAMVADIGRANGAGARVLVGDDATLESVRAGLKHATWAHFACHGDFDVSAPHRSGMFLRNPIDRSNVRLTLADVASMSLPNLRLVVLSSCWTGTEGVLPGRELIGLPQAFIGAGVETVIAPLWRVDDDLGPVFMRDFYTRLLQMSPAAALAETQAEWSTSTDPKRSMAAYAWAGFRVFAGATSDARRLPAGKS